MWLAVGQSPSRVWLFATPWVAARQASLALTVSRSLPKFVSIASVMPSCHLIPRCPLLLPSIFPSIRHFSNESAGCIRWSKHWTQVSSHKGKTERIPEERGRPRQGRQWPWRARVQFLRQDYLHNPGGPLMDSRDWQLQVIWQDTLLRMFFP